MLIAPRHLLLIKIPVPPLARPLNLAAPRLALSNCRIPLAGLRRGLASDILNHLISRDGQIDAQRLGNTEHEPIADLPGGSPFPGFADGSYSSAPSTDSHSWDPHFATMRQTVFVPPGRQVPTVGLRGPP